MDEIDQHVDYIMKNLELSMRGEKVDETGLRNHSKMLYLFVSSKLARLDKLQITIRICYMI